VNAVPKLMSNGRHVASISGVAAQNIRMMIRGKRGAEGPAAFSGADLGIDPAIREKFFRNGGKTGAEVSKCRQNHGASFRKRNLFRSRSNGSKDIRIAELVDAEQS